MPEPQDDAGEKFARPGGHGHHGRHVEGRGHLEITEEEFESMVIEELDKLPDDIVDGLENVVFVTESLPEDGSLDVLGLYEGVAVTERDTYGFGELPDRIVLYRLPLLDCVDDLEEFREQIRVTLIHEIAHYYGISDEHLHTLGWG